MPPRVCLLLAFLGLATAPARANMAPPGQPGTAAGEPVAALAGLRIAREALTLDLRRLAAPRAGSVRFATVEATYTVENASEPRVLPLEFVALGQDVDAAQVWLDGQPLEAQEAGRIEVPALWTSIAEAPGLDGAPTPFAAETTAPRGLRFTVAPVAGAAPRARALPASAPARTTSA